MQKHTSKTLILVKALPHPTKNSGETVCCAGVTLSKEWVRLFPVRFRILSGDKQFRRWQWVEYQWIKPKDDRRVESQRLQEESISIGHTMPPRERPEFLRPLILPSTDEAAAQGKTLTLIRPVEPIFSYRRKTDQEIEIEKAEYVRVASQRSFLDPDLRAFDPSPYFFGYKYKSEDGKKHKHQCGDWETAATFLNWRRKYGEAKTLDKMTQTFGEDYPSKGVVFAMGTMFRYPKNWLLVGVIRLDQTTQLTLQV